MYIADSLGVLSSVLYGPDHRTRIKPETRNAFFTVYAPPGVAETAVQKHLDELYATVLVISPSAEVELNQVHQAN